MLRADLCVRDIVEQVTDKEKKIFNLLYKYIFNGIYFMHI